MIFNEIQLTEVEKFAALFFSYKEISILIDVDYKCFKEEVTDVNSPVYRAYQRGKLLSESEIREQIIKDFKGVTGVVFSHSNIISINDGNRSSIKKTAQEITVQSLVTLKNGKEKETYKKSFVTHTYCPFCGVKYEN